ncbi:MAG: prepilin peptidase, partial [Planctomycetales bacterium]|nr:prepilin peptidase [Planctomycetales bacterium]
SGLGMALGGFATGFGILLLLWLIGGGGGGDVKLMGAVGVWLGALPTLIVFIASAGFAILCTVGIIVWNQINNHPTASENSAESLGESSDENTQQRPLLKQTVPYALPVAMSIWALLLFHTLENAKL